MIVQAGFGGGCHWCTEAVFQALKGVTRVEQGYICAVPPDVSFSEAVLVTFDPGQISLAVLIEVHLRTHASTSEHKMRGKYRSAVYVFDEDQAAASVRAIKAIQADLGRPVVTRILEFCQFKPSDARYQNYYSSDPEKPFCRVYIDPKLNLLRQEYSEVCKNC